MLGVTRYSDTLTFETNNNEIIEEKKEKYSVQKIGCMPGCVKKSKSAKDTSTVPPILWNNKVPNTELEKFQKLIEEKYNRRFNSYWEFQKWSTENFADFWEEVWHYLQMEYSSPYDQVYRKTGNGFLDCEWFPGAKFNFAENLMRIRDDRVAIIYADETGYEETVTFAEMYEEVKLYAAAFKKNGLKKGDRVACYISNRKEAVFVLLAATSMGAIFGGSQPYYGARSATNIFQKMEPKFLISIDHHTDSRIEFHNIDHLQYIADNTPSLEKIIIIPTKSETLSRDITNIRNSCLLEDFLNTGRTLDGTVPDLEFEQLPFDHPICINFTSGTTGLPKGPVHSAGSLISHLSSVVFYWNLKCGDVIYTCYPVGWTLWDTFVVCLAWGVKLFLYAGNPVMDWKGQNLWDVFSQFKVTYTFLATSLVDKLEKQNTVPGPNTNLDSLKFLTMGGSPVKAQNYLYVHNKVKKDVFVCSQYGSSETFGTFSGFDLNMPVYAGEIQAPALGMDIHCFDEEGNSVLNKRGEMVLATPTPALPTNIWKDHNNSIMKETYLSKYPGVWCQNDEIWINPKTKGLVVIGRSDDTLIQNGDRFGAGDVYYAIHDIDEIQDAICVGQQNPGGDCRAVLFIKMKEGYSFTPEFRERVKKNIGEELWFECVPQLILETKEIPYNLNNKKMESIVRKIVATNQVPDVNNIKNPECLQYYCDIPEILAYDKL
ncbi:acetoacetyl-CoA synthetase [Nephila pilipes]|uniref:Acetoacetyl-CoA synthetase n=1 Tax=Nephila pilipes TaxID=299642 RepID=A0A8X6NHN6_NEPPI|nr:acetoacetyl-CoA synthetase [Nephila pilipes]